MLMRIILNKTKPRHLTGVLPLSTAVTLYLGSVVNLLDAAEILQAMTVVGGRDAVYELSGSAAYLDAEEFRQRGYTNIAQRRWFRKLPQHFAARSRW